MSTLPEETHPLCSLLGAAILIPFGMLVVLVIWATGYGETRI